MNQATESIVKIVESIFPHRLYQSPETLDQVRKRLAQIPAPERETVLKDLEAMKLGFGSGCISGFGEENWAICVSLFGPAASGCARRAWGIAEAAWNRPADFVAVCDALRQMQDGLPSLAPDIVSRFNDTVRQLPGEFARCTNEAARFAVGVERPCALVRLLGACGQSARAATRALRKYRWFIAGKSFIQSSMTIIDLDAGRVTPPPASPSAQVEAALRAVMGVRYYIRKALIAALWAAILVALWWKPLGSWPMWLKIILSIPSTLYFLVSVRALVRRLRD